VWKTISETVVRHSFRGARLVVASISGGELPQPEEMLLQDESEDSSVLSLVDPVCMV
jgi:hypothetical protein